VITVSLDGYGGKGRATDFVHVSPSAIGVVVTIMPPLSDALEHMPPTQDAYDAACRAIDHWREEARRLGEIAGETPRQMTKPE
jgi:hypothetical protein